MCNGFIQIPSDFFESDYWCCSRTYSEVEAILDIITQIRTEVDSKTATIGGREVTWGQNEWPVSVRTLAERWKWTERRTRTFLSSLKNNGIIDVDNSQGVSVIRLIKYTSGDTTNDTANDTNNGLNINELVELVTQRVTQRLTQQGNIIIQEQQSREETELSLFDDEVMCDEFTFNKFWELYDKKVGKDEAEKLYSKMSRKDRKAIFEYVPRYKNAQPDKSKRVNPARFLRRRVWEDEIIDYNQVRRNPIGFDLTDNTNKDKYKNDIDTW